MFPGWKTYLLKIDMQDVVAPGNKTTDLDQMFSRSLKLCDECIVNACGIFDPT